jgi:hypothetical protein
MKTEPTVTNLPAWTPSEPYKPGTRIKAFGHDVIVDPVIDGRHLAKHAGVPSVALRDWRRRRLIPKARYSPSWWIAVVKDLYETEIRPKNLIKMAKARHRF